MPFTVIPNLCVMIRRFFMTLIAGIIFFTAFEFYSDNINWRVIMFTTGMLIHRFAVYADLIHMGAKVENDLEKKKFV